MIKNLMELLDQGVSPYHGAAYVAKFLARKFTMLPYGGKWDIKEGGRYLVMPSASMLIAFTVGKQTGKTPALKLALSHIDSPALKVKPNALIEKKGYCQINTEPYGGIIGDSWFDIPLGLAGKVVRKGTNGEKMKTVLFDSGEPVFVIPRLAIHMKRDRSGELDMQKELLPIGGLRTEEEENKGGNPLEKYILQKMEGEFLAEDILDYDLFLYHTAKAQTAGFKKEFILSPRLDNLVSAAAIMEAIQTEPFSDAINIGVFFDHEEVGSQTRHGADSSILSLFLAKLLDQNMFSSFRLYDMLPESFMLSVDGAHGFHPNYEEKNDLTNISCLGDGVVVKKSGSQKYLSDSEAAASLILLCQENQIPYRFLANRSGIPGGRTLGPIAASYLPMNGVDLGIGMLAMHSSSEMAAAKDYEALYKLLKAFYERFPQ